MISTGTPFRFFARFLAASAILAMMLVTSSTAWSQNVSSSDIKIIQSHTIKIDNPKLTIGTIDLPKNETQIVITSAKEKRKSGPICGGVVNGKAQKRCGKKPAVFESKAIGRCPKGSFFDIGKWQCWSCPKGFNRTLAAVDSNRAPNSKAKAA